MTGHGGAREGHGRRRGLRGLRRGARASLLRFGWLLTADADADAAQDLVQEALTRLVPAWGRVAAEAREAYTRTTMRRLWVDTWRRRRGWHEILVGVDGAVLAVDPVPPVSQFAPRKPLPRTRRAASEA